MKQRSYTYNQDSYKETVRKYVLRNPDSFKEQILLLKIRILLRESNMILSSGNRNLLTLIT
jgi:hypothetical protein